MISQLLLACNSLTCCKSKGWGNHARPGRHPNTPELWVCGRLLKASGWAESSAVLCTLQILPLDWHTNSLGCGSLHSRPFICTADGLLPLHMCTDHRPSMYTGHYEIPFIKRQPYHSAATSQLNENSSFSHFVPSCYPIHVPDFCASLCWCLHWYCISYETCFVGTCCDSQCANDKLLFNFLIQNIF